MKKLLLSLLISTSFMQANAEAAESAPALSASCAACHGQSGVSSTDAWPNLAGQQIDYLIKEITAFRDGNRIDPTMPAALLSSATDQQITELAIYYNSMPAAAPAAKNNSEAGKHVRARCVSCHGMSGISVTSLWPNLSGQKESYLSKQLLDYKAGRRKHAIMEVIGQELNEQQIKDVAKYYSQH